ncbi:MAG TPA: DUF1761 domain-containing protein [Candidatus Saccharimonadales bacterium]|nr:DUF1761 domain-containing protein [Candidatus Saccharimonadales bacterium]
MTILVNIGVWYCWNRLPGSRRRATKPIGSFNFWLIILISAIQAWVLVHFVRYAGALGVIDGIEAGFWLWLGLIAPALAVTGAIERKTWKYTRTAIYFLVITVLDSALLATWR